ncbi:hypothetical protein OHC33_011233 [Knufia fluminis]|uniref:Uncharacterized protein n=1 Tax=Knufia fluminis TaxID=191047 RepID=A0AAN8EEI1_9EURO|nr:hypothetical protein OHC33_011233 [Knufia fluminis]
MPSKSLDPTIVLDIWSRGPIVHEKWLVRLQTILHLEVATQMRLPPSSPTLSPVAATDEDMDNEETRANDNSVFAHEELEDATTEQGTSMNHEPVHKEPVTTTTQT